MTQIKPFLFWIVIGSILFLELLWWLLSIPAIDVVGNKATGQAVKSQLDSEYKHLLELEKKAKNGSPMGVFDAEKEADIRRLTNDYLVTPAWKDVLAPHVRRYDEQLTAIKKELAARSKKLAEPIANSNDKFGWYSAYQAVTEEQLKKLVAAQALVLPAVPAAAPTTKPGPATGEPAAAPAIDFATDPAVRSVAGFFTKGAELPEPSEYPLLTRQFRAMERVISVVLATTAANQANAAAGVIDTPDPLHAAIAGVTWDTVKAADKDAIDTTTAIGGETGSYATGVQLQLTLAGPASAILLTAAELEHPKTADAPLLVVTGIDLTRKAGYLPGERKAIGQETAIGHLTVLVLDFSQAPDGVKHAEAAPAPAPPAAPPRPPKRTPGTAAEKEEQ